MTWEWGHTGAHRTCLGEGHFQRCSNRYSSWARVSIHLNDALLFLHFLKLHRVHTALFCEGPFENSSRLWQRMSLMYNLADSITEFWCPKEPFCFKMVLWNLCSLVLTTSKSQFLIDIQSVHPILLQRPLISNFKTIANSFLRDWTQVTIQHFGRVPESKGDGITLFGVSPSVNCFFITGDVAEPSISF